jgi:hypothetical protein
MKPGAIMSSEYGGNKDKGAALLSRLLKTIRDPAALAFSYQAEDAAVLHLLLDCGAEDLEVFTLDTNKLFPETVYSCKRHTIHPGSRKSPRSCPPAGLFDF